MEKLNRQKAGVQTIHPIRILQFGAGKFLRGFWDWAIDELNNKTDFSGAVRVVKPTASGDYAALRSQEGVFRVYTRGLRNGEPLEEIHLSTCIQDILHPYREWSRFLASAEDPDTRIIFSNTTEAGIAYREEEHMPDQAPVTFPGKLTRWLFHRFTHLQDVTGADCHVIPSELIPDNGQALQKAVLKYAGQWSLGAAFTRWLVEHVHFYNTLVDRIVTDARDEQDQQAVQVEPYFFLAIEKGAELESILPLQKAGLSVLYPEDLEPYRKRKVRILNGLHTVITPLGYLNGFSTVRSVLEDPLWQIFVRRTLNREILPVLDGDPDEPAVYAEAVLERFLNPYLEHQLMDISLNSISKFRYRVWPTILEYHARFGHYPRHLIQAFVYLIHFYRGLRGEEPIELRDDPAFIRFFQEEWEKFEQGDGSWKALVQNILADTDLWGRNLSAEPGLLEAILKNRLDDRPKAQKSEPPGRLL